MNKRRPGCRSARLEGQKFGKLTVVSRSGTNKHGSSEWNCSCDCGGVATSTTTHLRNGTSKSCGCHQIERTKAVVTTHGHSAGGLTTEYKRWLSMKNRCARPDSEVGRWHAARGIKVCDRWVDDFPAFLADMGPIPSQKHTLDRIDNDKGYDPTNCRWADAEQQSNNKRTNRFVEVNGQRLTLTQTARAYGITVNALRWRLGKGQSASEAVGIPSSSSEKLKLGYQRP